jgi:hypothetical protein
MSTWGKGMRGSTGGPSVADISGITTAALSKAACTITEIGTLYALRVAVAAPGRDTTRSSKSLRRIANLLARSATRLATFDTTIGAGVPANAV